MSVPNPPPSPDFRGLPLAECQEILRRHQYGRLAFTFHDRVDIEPIHYVYEHPWIVARTGEGTKLTVLTHHPWVAFEVDEVEAMFSWRSVVVKGTVYMLDGGGADAAMREQAIAIYRRLLPAAFTPADPLPGRGLLFHIHIDEYHGRGASQASP